MRLQALWLLRNGQSIHDGAAAIGCHPRTAPSGVAWERKEGLEDVRRHRKGGRGHACRLSDAQVAELKQKAAAGQLQRVQDAVAWVKARYQVEDPWSGMYSLVPRAGLRKKVPRPFNPKASVEAHDAWKKGGLPLRQRRPGRAPQTWIGVTTCASDGVGRCAGCGRRAGERSSSREHGSAHGSP
jgi:transposase